MSFYNTVFKKIPLMLSVIILIGCASSVRLDDLPSVESNSTALNTSVANKHKNNHSQIDLRAINDNNDANGVTIKTVDTTDNPIAEQPTQGLLSQRSIYFDYDSFILRDDVKNIIQAHADFLKTRQQKTITLAGHTDDRGGREYNLALGQKRAIAVQKALQLLGVNETQLEAVSFGKEKPKAQGQTEADYAQNRRVDIQYNN